MNGLHLWYYYAPRKKIYAVWCDDYPYCSYNTDLEDGIMKYLRAIKMTADKGKTGYERWDYVREHRVDELRGMCEVERLATRKDLRTYPRKRKFQ